MSPKEWKNGGYKEYSNEIIKQSKFAMKSKASFDNITPTIVKMKAIESYYIRNRGYNKNIEETWQKLQTWIYTNDIKSYKQMALHHDNPIITPLEDCQYIAIAVLDENEELKDLSLPTLDIPKGIYAKFSLSGKYGDVIKLIQWVYHYWLIDSGYETTTNPSYTIYHKNHFLSDDEEFVLDYYLPIKYV